MMNPKIRAAALDFIKSHRLSSITELEGQAFHYAYAAECRLFNDHFKVMSNDELAEYRKFVVWIHNSGLVDSDLTVDELYDTYESKPMRLMIRALTTLKSIMPY